MEMITYPERLCRLCMSVISSDEQVVVDLREPTAEDFVDKMRMFSIVLTPAANWPSRVCGKCVALVQRISDFHDLIMANQNLILRRFGSAGAGQLEPEGTTEDQFFEEEDVADDVEEEVEVKEHVLIIEEHEKPIQLVELETESACEPVKKSKERPPKRDFSDYSNTANLRRTTRVIKSPVKPPPKVAAAPTETPEKVVSRIDKRERVKQIEAVIQTHAELLKCEICGEKNFTTFHEVTGHYRSTHLVRGYIKCCGITFTSRHKLATHIGRHSVPQAFLCEKCPKSYATITGLVLHKEKHVPDEEKQYPCPLCPRRFTRPQTLHTHRNLMHSAKNFECPECDRRFVNNSQLQFHVRTVHEDVRQFICDLCAKAFKTKQTMAEHRKTHFDRPRIRCDECGKLYKNELQVRKHKTREHSGDKGDRECPYCKTKPKNANALKAHIRAVHERTKEFKCDVCEKTFKKALTLREHMAGHTGQKLYSCKFCDQEFNSSANRYKHQKQRHPQEYGAMKQDREMKMYAE